MTRPKKGTAAYERTLAKRRSVAPNLLRRLDSFDEPSVFERDVELPPHVRAIVQAAPDVYSTEADNVDQRTDEMDEWELSLAMRRPDERRLRRRNKEHGGLITLAGFFPK